MNQYIEKVDSLITNKRYKKQILTELQSHLDDKTDYYVELGYDREEAERRAAEDMGNPEDTAVSLNFLHNDKWYQVRQNIIAFVLILGAIAGTVFFYPKYFYSDDVFQAVTHSVISDFISLAIFSVYVGLIIFAARKRNSRIVYAILFSLILALILSFSHELFINTLSNENNQLSIGGTAYDGFFYRTRNVFCVFQPMLYALGTIVTQGFTGYIDSLFSYSLIDDYMKNYYVIGSFVLFVFLFLWAFVVLVMINRQSKLKSTKHFTKPLKITRDIMCIFIVLNFAVMSACTVVSSFSFEEKLRESNAARSAAVDFVLNTKIGEPKEQVTERVNLLLSDYGFKEHETDNFASFDVKEIEKNCFSVILIFSDGRINSLIFSTITSDNNFLTANLRVDKNDLQQYRENTPLETIKNNGLFDKVFSVSKNDDIIQFGFVTEDNVYSLMFSEQANNRYKLTINTANSTEEGVFYENQ